MSMIDNEDVRGYRIGKEIVCPECITEEEQDKITEKDVIITKEIEDSDKQWFCDRSGEQL